jgi:hypothetical protein
MASFLGVEWGLFDDLVFGRLSEFSGQSSEITAQRYKTVTENIKG